MKTAVGQSAMKKAGILFVRRLKFLCIAGITNQIITSGHCIGKGGGIKIVEEGERAFCFHPALKKQWRRFSTGACHRLQTFGTDCWIFYFDSCALEKRRGMK